MAGSHDEMFQDSLFIKYRFFRRRMLPYSPGSILQVRMGQLAFVAAHPAADLHCHSTLGPCLGHVAASGTIVQEASFGHDRIMVLFAFIFFDDLLPLPGLVSSS